MLRDYQQQIKDGAKAAHARTNNVLIVVPTGGGKTVILSVYVSEHVGAACVIAHRQELVGQISVALARQGVRHRIIGTNALIKLIVARHIREVGQSFYDPNSPIAAAGVDTLIRRKEQLAAWCQTVTLWVQDEAHHVLAGNKWGEAASMFPNAKGLGVTATPERADGKGLGRDYDGLFDEMIVGPSLRDMIWLGWLCDYTIFSPPSDFVVSDADIGSTGDYSRPKMSKAAKKSHIIGDVVEHYTRIAPGKKFVAFYPDVETAVEGAQEFKRSGYKVEAVSGKTDDRVRNEMTQRLQAGSLDALTNCDIFGEGFDLPTIFGVTMARPTASFSLFCQQAGRALRPVYAPGMPLDTPEQRRAAIAAGPKPRAVIIDHVENVRRHAIARTCNYTGETVIDLCHRDWTLARRESRGRAKQADDVIPLTTCTKEGCFRPYESIKPRCPYCGFKAEPQGRATPEQVAGDLCELTPDALAKITGEIARVDAPVNVPPGLPAVAEKSLRNKHYQRQVEQKKLRESIAWWAAWQRQAGREDSESYRLFYLKHGVDVATAQTLGAREASELNDKIALEIAGFIS